MTRERVAKPENRRPALGGRDKQLDALARVADSMEGWGTAEEVLRPVRAVPTLLVQLDRATRVGGWPIDRVGLVSGPSGDGKTTLQLAIQKSFVARRHYVGFIDAELTTPAEWVQIIFGPLWQDPYRAALYRSLRPRTYEEAVDEVRKFCKTIEAAREPEEKSKGKRAKPAKGEEKKVFIPRDTTGIVTVDSIRKLVPDRLMEKIGKFGAQGEKGSIDGMGGRAAQYKAALNAQWLDEVTPLTYHSGTALLFITRETEDEEGEPVAGGGKALVYDSSMHVRVTASPLWIKDEKRVVGTRHSCSIEKTKVSATTTEHARFNFYTSNGIWAPEGLWPERDIFELAKFYGIVEAAGAWFSYRGEKWNGEPRALAALREKPDLVAALEADVRARFAGESDQDLGSPLSEEDEKPDLSGIFA